MFRKGLLAMSVSLSAAAISAAAEATRAVGRVKSGGQQMRRSSWKKSNRRWKLRRCRGGSGWSRSSASAATAREITAGRNLNETAGAITPRAEPIVGRADGILSAVDR